MSASFFRNQDDDDFARYCSGDEECEGGDEMAMGPISNVPPRKKDLMKDSNENCCTRCGRKSFGYLFPAKGKVAYTYQGLWLRKMLWCGCFNHAVFFVFCLWCVGFKSCLTNLVLGFWAYSCSLTLREKLTFCYFLLLVAATVTELIYDLETRQDSMQKIGLIVNVCFYGVLLFFVGKAWWSFRSTGGLKGDPNSADYANNILPEFLTEAGKKIASAAIKKGEAKLDEAIEKDKKLDKAAADFSKKSKSKGGE